MNILLLGSGGREHALAWKLAQSRLLAGGGKLYAAPGNPGIAEHAELVDLDRLGMLRDPRIARRGVKRTAVRGDEAGLRQLPCQRMFAPARSQQQDVHARPYSE